MKPDNPIAMLYEERALVFAGFSVKNIIILHFTPNIVLVKTDDTAFKNTPKN